MLKAADLFQAGALLKHCLDAFGRGLTAGTAVEALVWAHGSGPEEALRIAQDFRDMQFQSIQVRLSFLGERQNERARVRARQREEGQYSSDTCIHILCSDG